MTAPTLAWSLIAVASAVAVLALRRRHKGSPLQLALIALWVFAMGRLFD